MKKFLFGLVVLSVMTLAQPAYAQQPCFYFDIVVDAQATQLGPDLWLYEYTLSAGPGGDCVLKDLSHWSLELPEHKIPTLSNPNPSSNVEIGYFKEPAIDDFIWGVKWDNDQLITYSFQSTHGPVLNPDSSINLEAYNWYAKSGTPFIDQGLTLGPNGGNGEEPVIPEPATALLLTTGLFSLIGLRRKTSVNQ